MAEKVCLSISHKITNRRTATAISRHNLRQEQAGGEKTGQGEGVNLYVKGENEHPYDFALHRIAEVRRKRGTTRALRKDAVKLVEICISVPARTAKENKLFESAGFLNRSVAWITDTFGEQNVAQIVLHMDESAPHIHALIVPITPDDRLASRDLFGPADLRRYHDTLSEQLAIFGLERGAKKTKVRHMSLKSYNSQIETITGSQSLTPPFGDISASQYYESAKVEHEHMMAISAQRLVDDQSRIQSLCDEVSLMRPKCAAYDALSEICPTVCEHAESLTVEEQAALAAMEARFRQFDADRPIEQHTTHNDER